MHRKYRGLNAYQASDIAIIIAATIELFILIARIERVYGVINYYAVNNRTLPYALLNAMGVSDTLADNIRDNLSDFRYAINNLIRRAQNVCIPKDLSVLLDKIALFGYVYKDHDSAKAQSIVFDCFETGIYMGDLTDTGGGIVFKDTSFSDLTAYDEIITYLRESVSALVEDSDVLRIYSDFLSYLDPSQFMTLIPLPEEYCVIPVYSEEILHKVHNYYSTDIYHTIDEDAETWAFNSGKVIVQEMIPTGLTFKTGYSINDGYRKIVQKDNVVHTRLCAYSDESGGSWTAFSSGELDGYNAFQWDTNEVLPAFDITGKVQIFDTYRNEAEPSIMLEGALFKFIPGVTGRVRFIKSCAWEVVNGMTTFTTINGNSISQPVYQFMYTSGYDANMTKSQVASYYESYLASVALVSQLDWAPILYRVIDDDLASIFFEATYPFSGDIDNCRLVGYTDIFRMHEVAVYSGLETAAAVVKE
nr:putative capsid protein [Picobirnavirus sp.]